MSAALQEVIENLGTAFDEFKRGQESRLDDIEKRMNRGALFGGGASHKHAEPPEARKCLEQAVRALVAGDQVKADKYFAQAQVEMKGMQVGVDPQGGYTVLPTFSTDMTRVMLEVSPFIGLARTIELTQGDTFEEIVDKEEAGADWVAELQSRDDTDTPDLGLLRIPAHEICAMPKVSQKLIDTSAIDVVGWLQGKVAEKFAHTETDAFFSGNGVTRPRGFLTYTTAATADATRAWGVLEHIPTGASGTFHTTNADPLIDTVAALKPQYRQGAVWLMNRKTMASLRKFKTTTGEHIFQPGLQEGQPPSLLGYPIVECEQMPDMSAGSLSIAFGNFAKGYTIVRRLGTRFLVDPYTDKPNVKLFTYTRVGGDVANFEAIKLVKFASS